MSDLPVHATPLQTRSPSGLRQGGAPHRIVIVGGGVGGLGLAISLCARLDAGSDTPLAEVVLVDVSRAHVWKPRLHEFAAGTLMPAQAAFDFCELSRLHGFHFHPGRLEALDRVGRAIWLPPLVDGEGRVLADRRALPYDTLVIATGSTSDPYDTPGVARHACTVDSHEDARRLHQRLRTACARGDRPDSRPVEVVIVGGGATGVELAIELSQAWAGAPNGSRVARAVRVTLVEASGQLLPTQPPHRVARVEADVAERGIDVRRYLRVVEVKEHSVTLEDGTRLASDVTVWTAGARSGLKHGQVDGLAINRQGQLLVHDTLQTTRDPTVFALGDCCQRDVASHAPPFVPTAQSAQHQARWLSAQLLGRRLSGLPLSPYLPPRQGDPVQRGHGAATAPATSLRRHQLLESLAMHWAYEALAYRHVSLLIGPLRATWTTWKRWLARQGRARIRLH